MRSDLALAALASAAVPGMKPVAVAGLVQDDETDHQQAVVEDATGRRWLVRTPLTPVAGARLRRGEELVRQLSRHVPFKVPAAVGYATVGRDGHAVVYPHVEGLPLDLTHLPAGTGLASAVGRAVAAIHNVPRGVFEEQDVPVFDAAGCRQRLIADVDRAAETGRVPTGLLARWEEAFDAAPLWQFATTPVHGAFRGATVLVVFADEDAASGRVVAVTDWEEVMVADPAVDLAELCSHASPAAWASVLDAYALARAQRPDAYLQARARLVAETRRLRGFARAVAEDDEPGIRRVVEALRRLDRLTEDEDSLVPTTARGAGVTAGSGDVGKGLARPIVDVRETQDAGAGEQSDRPEGGEAAPEAQDATPETEDAVSEAQDATPETEDATAEVPVIEALAAHGGHVTDSMDESAHTDGEDPGAVSEDGEVDDDGPAAAPTDDGGATEPDGLEDDEDRLHELYGMPDQEGGERS